ncbi:MAG: hypothetical protein AB7S93_20780 [Xanthobacteraceae bacterium]
MERARRIAALMAQPPDVAMRPAGRCWAFAAAAEQALFGRVLPAVAVSQELDVGWVKHAFACHPEHQRWALRPPARHGLADAMDGSLVLMSGAGRPHHVGVWLKAERAVLHADHQAVKLEDVVTLKARGFTRLRFYEPKA